MKKLWYLVMAFGLVACQAEKVDVDGDGGDVETNYLSVNIMAANGGLTRSNYKDGYEDGIEDESAVNSFLFYFFDGSGNPSIVDFSSGTSYKFFSADEFPSLEENNDKPNVTDKRNVKIILQSKDGVTPPSQTIVIVNPDFDPAAPTGVFASNSKNPSLTEVREAMTEFASNHNYEVSGNSGFVMTNSVHLHESANDHLASGAVSIQGHVKETEQLAKDNSVEIYVERVVAKVQTTIGSNLHPVTDGAFSGKSNVFNTGETYFANDVQNEIYVQFNGWNVTATANQSYLVKHIAEDFSSWTNTIDSQNLFKTQNQPWNYADFHRSFWAVNPEGTSVEYGPFQNKNDGKSNYASLISGFTADNYTYLPENAGQSISSPATKNPSQVIIAATLLDKEGNELQLAEFGGDTFVDKFNTNEAQSYTKMKEYILASLGEYYYLDPTQGEATDADHYVKIAPKDIVIKSANTVKKEGELESGGRYFVYAQLAETSKYETWYKAKPTAENLNNSQWKTDNALDADGVNAALSKIGSAKIWKNGQTYYYFEIRHLAEMSEDSDFAAQMKQAGYFGVVRNHVYKCAINSLKGLGTPVYDPDEVIIPEKPNEKEWFLAAEINILSWRIVDHSYDMVW